MASRPLVTVQSPTQQKLGTVALPDVLTAPIRVDLVQDVHTKMNKNHRQPYAVSKDAGEQTSARSWGTGRAVSRIPRVPGGGTHRSGQGAFGNMCRGGRMFSPTKVWRRWNVAVNKGQRRYAVCSALSASALAPLVMARGHRIESIAEVPLVVSDVEIDTITKTKEAVALLKALGVGSDLERVKASHSIRRGKGKARNRRYVQRRGPLLIHNKERGSGIVPAFRNIAGVDTCNVNRLNLLQLAPGGHLGRFIIWTESAFKELDRVFGTKTVASQQKHGFMVPACIMSNADLGRVLKSQEVQLAIRPTIRQSRLPKKKNPFNNLGSMIKLNPFELTRRRRAIASQNTSKKRRHAEVRKNREFIRQLREPAIAPQRGEEEKFPF